LVIAWLRLRYSSMALRVASSMAATSRSGETQGAAYEGVTPVLYGHQRGCRRSRRAFQGGGDDGEIVIDDLSDEEGEAFLTALEA